ncbi:MAG: hypothetical protein HUJ29_02630 [Gammaproteobacteria bacterium]|nr:hypothetical protein [Gammaproteobacteria bacterium]
MKLRTTLAAASIVAVVSACGAPESGGLTIDSNNISAGYHHGYQRQQLC